MAESILEEAQRIIHGERNKQYGHPRDNLGRTARLFSGYLGVEVSDLDVANLMILVKLSRISQTGYQRDSYTDIAGYAGCAERCQEPEYKLDEAGLTSKQKQDISRILLGSEPWNGDGEWAGANVLKAWEPEPHVWPDWETLDSEFTRGMTPAGTMARNEHGVIWKLHKDDDLVRPGGSAWFLEADHLGETNGAWVGNLHTGPFTEILG